jgi:uncharacterized protein YdaU (DUF1376 family)
MGKDPAFLFYSSDFLTGVQFMSLEERGAYITLLAAQHQHGHIDPKRVGLLLGFGWDMLSDTVKEKFEIDDTGKIFNSRLDDEVEKRALYTEKQRNNGQRGGRPRNEKNPNETQTITQTQTQTKPKNNPTENENENRDLIELGKGVKGKNQNNTDFMFELSNNEIWIEQTCMALKTDKTTIRMKLAEACALFDSRGEDHSQLRLFQSHFVNWLREDLKKPKQQKSKGQQQPDQLMDLILNQTKDATHNLNQ